MSNSFVEYNDRFYYIDYLNEFISDLTIHNIKEKFQSIYKEYKANVGGYAHRISHTIQKLAVLDCGVIVEVKLTSKQIIKAPISLFDSDSIRLYLKNIDSHSHSIPYGCITNVEIKLPPFDKNQ